MGKQLSRRKMLSQLGMAAGAALPLNSWINRSASIPIPTVDHFLPQAPDKPITAITLGAGNRGNVYGNYATAYPHHIKMVGVAEPIAARNEHYAQQHGIPANQRFKTWEEVFKQPKFADAVIISTPDRLHYGPCMQALKMGYDVLLEKPISPSEQECREILEFTKKSGRIVAVCHVLRYAPYFIKLRELVQSGGHWGSDQL